MIQTLAGLLREFHSCLAKVYRWFVLTTTQADERYSKVDALTIFGTSLLLKRMCTDREMFEQTGKVQTKLIGDAIAVDDL